MSKLLFVGAAVAFVLSGALWCVANAQEAPASTNRMAICGAEWKAEKAKPDFVKPAKGEGMAKWQAFRKECFTRHPKPAKAAKAS
jgi:hypothetical protein